MAVIEKKDVQQWLEATKATISLLSEPLEETARTLTFAELNSYDSSTWVSPTTTPLLVRKIVAIRVAAWEYIKAYSEDETETGSYGLYLLSQADKMVAGINAGDLTLVEVPGENAATSTPSYYPDDTTGMMQQYDEAGRPVGNRFASGIKFRMGQTF